MAGVAIVGAAAFAASGLPGISGWTGFAPLTLAKEAGIFKKNGIDATITKIPQASRHLAIASGNVQCAATTVETWIVWNANGVAMTSYCLETAHLSWSSTGYSACTSSAHALLS